MPGGIPTTARVKAMRRDGLRCKLCGATSGLDVYRIIGVRQGKAHGLSGQVLASTRNLHTLCRRCHDLTYRRHTLRYWYTPRQFTEMAAILKAQLRLDEQREQLQARSPGMWGGVAYLGRKRQLDRKQKELSAREKAIRREAEKRRLKLQERTLAALERLPGH